MATGAATEVGRIAGSLAVQERRRSPLQRELDRLVRILLVAALALIAFVTIVGFVRGRTLGENLLAGISAAIAAIPEEPPVLLAVILGLGAYRLLRRGVLVRRLNAEETLGAVDLIVTDKTGTLTRNRLEVSSLCDLDGPIAEPQRRRDPHRRASRRGRRLAPRRRGHGRLVHGGDRPGDRGQWRSRSSGPERPDRGDRGRRRQPGRPDEGQARWTRRGARPRSPGNGPGIGRVRWPGRLARGRRGRSRGGGAARPARPAHRRRTVAGRPHWSGSRTRFARASARR